MAAVAATSQKLRIPVRGPRGKNSVINLSHA